MSAPMIGHAFQRGASLLEALIAILLFSIGTLALVGLFAMSIGSSADAQFRSEASAAAGQLINAVSGAVRRDTSGEVVRADLDRFALPGAGAGCPFEGVNAAADPLVRNWVTRLAAERTGLPGAGTAGYQRVLVDSRPEAFNRVTVTICWNQPGEKAPRTHEVIGYVN